MGNYNNKLLMIISLFVLIIPIAFSIDFTTVLNSNCSVGSGQSYETNSSYSQSLLYLLQNLCANAPTNNGFWSAAWPQDSNSTVYGLALCRCDLSINNCDMCLATIAINVIKTYCPNSRGAIILNDYCMLKYSDIDFRGQIDSNIFYFAKDNRGNVSVSEAVGLLNDLSETAIATPNKFYAKGMTKNMLYGMVQCTRDLSVGSCTKCLNDSTSYILRNCTDGDRGAQVNKGSCRVRYETYPFLV